MEAAPPNSILAIRLTVRWASKSKATRSDERGANNGKCMRRGESITDFFKVGLRKLVPHDTAGTHSVTDAKTCRIPQELTEHHACAPRATHGATHGRTDGLGAKEPGA